MQLNMSVNVNHFGSIQWKLDQVARRLNAVLAHLLSENSLLVSSCLLELPISPI